MKKSGIICMLICVVLLFSGTAYADGNDAAPCYNVVSAANTFISSEDAGVRAQIWIFVPYETTLDKVVVEVELLRSSGATAATYNQTMTKQGNVFMFDRTAAVTVSSTYVFEYTAKCYKNNVLVDTITGTSASVNHTV